MNLTRLSKEFLLPDWARRDMKGAKGDRVKHRAGLCSSNILEFFWETVCSDLDHNTDNLHYFFSPATQWNFVVWPLSDHDRFLIIIYSSIEATEDILAAS